jgi:pimeloyl-ACP methyl ester carboxylesterase
MAGLVDLVEAMHQRIARASGFSASTPQWRTGGITGLAYQTIRGITRTAGGSLDALLSLAAATEEGERGPEQEALVAALNGVLGDYLAASSNPLATPMSFRRDGRALALETSALAAAMPEAGTRVLVLLHGLCMNDRQWSRDGHDHGAALARDLGFTPVYLRYNSGLHISINGQMLAQRLEALLGQWPHPVQRLALLGHSMGGLLARSALHYGTRAGHCWPEKLVDMVFLGTPHHGATLERAGNRIDRALGATPYTAPLARLGRIRSAGITDMRFGNLLDEDWAGRDRFAHGPDPRQCVPLPPAVRCYAIAGSMGRKNGDLKDRLVGDGLVPLDSALGSHPDTNRTLAFPQDRRWVGYAMSHLALLSHPDVYARLRHWLT